VAENPRIEEFRRRVLKDKASIAFAQLAEEYRRDGRFQEAIDTCRTGLLHHPGYLSAHVTLGRALIETGELQSAQDELRRVLAAAPENLAAIRGLAEIHHRRGEPLEALAHYRRALEFAPQDPDLEHLVSQITRELQPSHRPPAVADGLPPEGAAGDVPAHGDRTAPTLAPADVAALDPNPLCDEPAMETVPEFGTVPSPDPAPPSVAAPELRAAMQVEALERWLDAILADREQRG
jgi:tetratricopeptide (TPR) repeat protein